MLDHPKHLHIECLVQTRSLVENFHKFLHGISTQWIVVGKLLFVVSFLKGYKSILIETRKTRII